MFSLQLLHHVVTSLRLITEKRKIGMFPPHPIWIEGEARKARGAEHSWVLTGSHPSPLGKE